MAAPSGTDSKVKGQYDFSQNQLFQKSSGTSEVNRGLALVPSGLISLSAQFAFTQLFCYYL